MTNQISDVQEKIIYPASGILALFMAVLFLFGGLALGWYVSIFLGAFFVLASFVLFSGVTTVNPNEAVVTQLFGNYNGTIYQNGILFVNPLTSTKKHSLKRQNFASGKVKVNDKRGNPIELAVIVSWRISNATKAEYNVEAPTHFVGEQVLGIFADEASKYSYDVNEHDKTSQDLSFRKNSVEIAENLRVILQKRVDDVGIEILELRFNHCAYSSEIAHAMLQKQQAEAMLDARKAIVDGAYKMVEELVEKFLENQKVKLTPEDIAKLTINLMTVLVSDKETTPVVKLDN